MYDNYPEHDVPQQNIIQMFFAQRWSAIIIEMAMAIVISVAAGRAFDFFGPIDAQTDNPPQEQAISLDAIQTYGMDDIRQGQSAEAEAMDDLVSDYANMYLTIAAVYDIFGYPAAAAANYEKYLEFAGENANHVLHLRLSALRGKIGQ